MFFGQAKDECFKFGDFEIANVKKVSGEVHEPDFGPYLGGERHHIHKI